MAGLKDIIPKSLQGQRMNDPSTWSGEGENIYGQEYGRKDQKENAYSEEQAVKVLDAVKKSLRDDKSVPKELFSKMMEIDPSNYAGFSGGEDFAEELNAFQSLISKNYRQREDGRYVFDDNLLLKEGQTPRGWVKDSYGFGTPVQQQEGQELFGIKPEDVVRY